MGTMQWIYSDWTVSVPVPRCGCHTFLLDDPLFAFRQPRPKLGRDEHHVPIKLGMGNHAAPGESVDVGRGPVEGGREVCHRKPGLGRAGPESFRCGRLGGALR